MNLDNILSKAKDVFESAYKKAGSAYRAGKHKLDITAIEAKLAKDYEALGRVCFEALSEGGAFPSKKAEPISDDINKKLILLEETKKNPPKDNKEDNEE